MKRLKVASAHSYCSTAAAAAAVQIFFGRKTRENEGAKSGEKSCSRMYTFFFLHETKKTGGGQKKVTEG